MQHPIAPFRFFTLALMALFLGLPGKALAAAPGGVPGSASAVLLKSVIVIVFFAAIAIFLRFLYGPKGRWREKHWDAMNSEFKAIESDRALKKNALRRLAALQEKLEPLMAKEGAVFENYVRSFYTGDAAHDELFRLKYEHSNTVFKNAWALINGAQELQEPQVARALLLAALYHDIGRFEQIRQHRAFNDALLDHSRLAVHLLDEQRFMSGQSPAMRRLVRGAIALHSRADLPASLCAKTASPLLLVARALRDADKLGILTVMREAMKPSSHSDPAISIDLPELPGEYNPEAAQAVLKTRPVLRAHLKSRNDLRLRLVGWAGFMEFERARILLARSGDLEAIMAQLPHDDVMGQVRQYVRERLG